MSKDNFQRAIASEDGQAHYLHDEEGKLLFVIKTSSKSPLPLVFDHRKNPPFSEVIPCPWCGTDQAGKHDATKHLDSHKRTVIVNAAQEEEKPAPAPIILRSGACRECQKIITDKISVCRDGEELHTVLLTTCRDRPPILHLYCDDCQRWTFITQGDDTLKKMREEMSVARAKAIPASYEAAQEQAKHAMGITSTDKVFWAVQVFDRFNDLLARNGNSGMQQLKYITSLFADTLSDLQSKITAFRHPGVLVWSNTFKGAWHVAGDNKVEDVRMAPKVKIEGAK